MEKSVEYLKERMKTVPETAVILGSGLGDFASAIEDRITVSYKDIPGFPVSTVPGHSGELIFGKVEGHDVAAMKGRIHYYEGVGIDAVVYPIKVLAELGIKNLIVTNAAGGANPEFKPGDLMVIRDHINFTGVNPLIGKNDDSKGPRFLDMTRTYDPELRDLAKETGRDLGIPLREGVYMWFTGPVYETPAEVKMAQKLGADAVGMSTVPEVIVAHHRGIKVLGISCITNLAAGILDQPLNHEEVMEVGAKVAGTFQNLVRNILKRMN